MLGTYWSYVQLGADSCPYRPIGGCPRSGSHDRVRYPRRAPLDDPRGIEDWPVFQYTVFPGAARHVIRSRGDYRAAERPSRSHNPHRRLVLSGSRRPTTAMCPSSDPPPGPCADGAKGGACPGFAMRLPTVAHPGPFERPAGVAAPRGEHAAIEDEEFDTVCENCPRRLRIRIATGIAPRL